MSSDHWFDALNRALVRDGPRRAVLNAAGAIAVILAGGPRAEAAKDRKKKKRGKGKGKNKGKGKDNKKGNGKGGPQQCGPDIHTLCDAAFRAPHTPEERDFCKGKCEGCKEAGTAFCIQIPDDDGPLRATCCHFADECCGGPIGECCTPDRCCASNDGNSRCLDPGETCCPSDPAGSCPNGQDCCPGKGCYFCPAPFVVNPDNCDQCVCPAGQIDCDGACIVGTECPDDGCSQPCPTGASCVNGDCVCPSGQTVCDGKCVDVRNDKKYCGSCVNVCRGTNECCQGAFCYNTESQHCCPPETHLGTCRHGDTCCESPTCAAPGQECR